MKKEISRLLRKNAKMQKKELKLLQSRAQEISLTKDRIRINTEKLAVEKWIRAKEMKE